MTREPSDGAGPASRARGDRQADGCDGDDAPPVDDEADLGDLFDELEELEDLVDTEAERRQVQEAMRAAVEVENPAVFGRVIWGFDRADLAEAVLGALLFGIPMAVEGGTNEAGAFVATNPVFLGATLVASVATVVGILYVTDIQDVRIRDPVLGVVPRRLLGVLGTALLTAVLLLTVWGRVDWADPWLAFCTCCVAFAPMSIGAALGDILPGS